MFRENISCLPLPKIIEELCQPCVQNYSLDISEVIVEEEKTTYKNEKPSQMNSFSEDTLEDMK